MLGILLVCKLLPKLRPLRSKAPPAPIVRLLVPMGELVTAEVVVT